MILQSMTPEEKVKQMEVMRPSIVEIAMQWVNRNSNLLRRTKVFPTMYTFDRNIPGMGMWTIIATVENKTNIKKGVFTVSAYQKFHVPYSKNKDNIGTGVYLFDANDEGGVFCLEFSPHCFLRFRQRLIDRKRIVQPSFPQLVKRVIMEYRTGMDTTLKGYKTIQEIDGKVRIIKTDDYDRYEGYDNLVSYTKNGLLLGMAADNRRYFCYTSFVSNEDLFEDQRREQLQMLKEREDYDFRSRNNPFDVFGVKRSLKLSDGTFLPI